MPDARYRPRRTLIPYSASLRELVPLALTANALRPITRTRRASAWAFVAGWHVSELPLATLIAQLAGTARTLRGGRWRTRDGAIRIAAQAASAAGLVELQRPTEQDLRARWTRQFWAANLVWRLGLLMGLKSRPQARVLG